MMRMTTMIIRQKEQKYKTAYAGKGAYYGKCEEGSFDCDQTYC
jgi:hypothetical protein